MVLGSIMVLYIIVLLTMWPTLDIDRTTAFYKTLLVYRTPRSNETATGMRSHVGVVFGIFLGLFSLGFGFLEIGVFIQI